MTPFAALLLAVAVPAADGDKKPAPPPARVTITAELACLHCTFGEGDSCAVCLKIDDKTPVLLEGKAAKEFEGHRLEKKILVAEGVLTVNKDKRLVLTSDKAHLFADADKGKAPENGQVRVACTAGCGHCDLDLVDSCTLAIKNAAFPIVLSGKHAEQHAKERDAGLGVTATGKPSLDKKGLLRLEAVKVEFEKKKEK